MTTPPLPVAGPTAPHQTIGSDRAVRPGLPPIYTHGCLTDQRFGDGTCEEVLHLADWMREPDGRVTIGALVLFADSVTGFATSTRLLPESSLVTAQLRLDVFRPVAGDEHRLRGVGTAMHTDDVVGFARAELSAPGSGMIAMATMRAAPVPLPGELRAEAPADGFADALQNHFRPTAVAGPGLRHASVDELLSAETVEQSEGRATVRVLARPDLTNAVTGVHGGVLAMMAERAVVGALATVAEPATSRPLAVDFSYLRPLPGDGSTVEASARIGGSTRRYVEVSGTVVRTDGRRAVRLRATFARGSSDGAESKSRPMAPNGS